MEVDSHSFLAYTQLPFQNIFPGKKKKTAFQIEYPLYIVHLLCLKIFKRNIVTFLGTITEFVGKINNMKNYNEIDNISEKTS